MKTVILSIMAIFCFSAYAADEKPLKVSCQFKADKVIFERESLEESDDFVVSESAGDRHTYLKTQKASSNIYVSKSYKANTHFVSINITHDKSSVQTYLDVPFSMGYGIVTLTSDDKEFSVVCREVAE